MDTAKLLEISEDQKEKLKQENKHLREEVEILRDKVKELLCQTPTKQE